MSLWGNGYDTADNQLSVDNAPDEVSKQKTTFGLHDILQSSPAEVALRKANSQVADTSLFERKSLFSSMSSLFDMVDIDG